MAKFRKKPIVIEAMQWDGTIEGGNEIIEWSNGSASWFRGWTSRLVIVTKEGVMEVLSKQWVIRGIQGEFYPCATEIFEATYDPVQP